MAHVGYIRVSSAGQNTARQLDGLTLDRSFEDHCSGKNTERPGLTDCMAYLRDGDTLHVHSFDRLARSLVDLINIVKGLTQRGVSVCFENTGMVFTAEASAMQTFMLSMFGAVAEFERALILERQAEGIEIAKNIPGKYAGRKPALSPVQIAEVVQRAKSERVTALAREFKVSRETIYAHVRACPSA